MSRLVLCFAGLSSHHCFKMFVLWRRSLQVPDVGVYRGILFQCSAVHDDAVSVCLLLVHEMIHLDFPFCIADLLGPRKLYLEVGFPPQTEVSLLTIFYEHGAVHSIAESFVTSSSPGTKCQQ